LLACAKSRDPVERRTAVYALAIIADRRAVQALVKAMSADEVNVRCYAAYGLGKIFDRRALAALVRALGDPDLEVRNCVRQALAMANGDRNIEILIDWLKHKDRGVRRHVPEALCEMTHFDFGRRQRKWREWLETVKNIPVLGEEECGYET
jgi:HEAT repeat protein